jgi:pimeloyl-ACP methyl ester carboxylesterase
MEERTIDLGGVVHYLDFGGRGAPIVLVHGLAGSAVNWLSVGDRLAAHGRTVALDLAGHGRTRFSGRPARVKDNRTLLSRFLKAVAREPATLIGNSMGGYLSLAQAAAEPESVRGLVLVAAAAPLPRGNKLDPMVGKMFASLMMPFFASLFMRSRARRGPEKQARDLLALCCVDSSRIDPQVVEAHLALAREREAYSHVNIRDFIDAARSLVRVLAGRQRYLQVVRRVRAPALIVGGEHDRLVRTAATRALADARPDWKYVEIPDVGHVPQLEKPEQFLAIVEPWLAAHRQAPPPLPRL